MCVQAGGGGVLGWGCWFVGGGGGGDECVPFGSQVNGAMMVLVRCTVLWQGRAEHERSY